MGRKAVYADVNERMVAYRERKEIKRRELERIAWEERQRLEAIEQMERHFRAMIADVIRTKCIDSTELDKPTWEQVCEWALDL